MSARPTPEPPGPDQESVWDYPRPPRIEPARRRIRVLVGDVVVADTRNAQRVLETSHPPTYYVPPEDVRTELLVRSPGSSACEWKGRAVYYDLVVGDRRIRKAAWTYPDPDPSAAVLQGHLAFYLSDAVEGRVDDERALPQPGGFYGGWVSSHVVGPFKGGPGTAGW